jgi:hypothetical protein
LSLKLTRLLSWALGKEVVLEWPSLWEESNKEKAETRLQNAQADKIWSVDIGALTAEDIGVSRAKDGSFGIDVDPDTIASEIAEQAAKEQAEQERALAEQVAKQQEQPPIAQGNNAPPAPIAPVA